MRMWKRIAFASAIGAAISLPAFAGDGDGLQSAENQHGNFVERNPVLAPPSAATRVPQWNGPANVVTSPGYGYDNNVVMARPESGYAAPRMVSPSMSATPSAAQESRATGNVDAQQARPPLTGNDVQAGDMGPSNAKGE